MSFLFILNICIFIKKISNLAGQRSVISQFINESWTVTFHKICLICFNESPLKIIKNTFHFTLKALFVLKIFNICLDFLVTYKKRLDQKGKVNLKIMTSQLDQQIIAIHILPNSYLTK